MVPTLCAQWYSTLCPSVHQRYALKLTWFQHQNWPHRSPLFFKRQSDRIINFPSEGQFYFCHGRRYSCVRVQSILALYVFGLRLMSHNDNLCQEGSSGLRLCHVADDNSQVVCNLYHCYFRPYIKKGLSQKPACIAMITDFRHLTNFYFFIYLFFPGALWFSVA